MTDLQDRIDRAVAALDQAPDVGDAKPTRDQVSAIVGANLRAWIILNEGRHPPSRKGHGRDA